MKGLILASLLLLVSSTAYADPIVVTRCDAGVCKAPVVAKVVRMRAPVRRVIFRARPFQRLGNVGRFLLRCR